MDVLYIPPFTFLFLHLSKNKSSFPGEERKVKGRNGQDTKGKGGDGKGNERKEKKGAPSASCLCCASMCLGRQKRLCPNALGAERIILRLTLRGGHVLECGSIP